MRKDVEKAFGVLQSRFAMMRGPCRMWDKETIWYIMTGVVILHNVIIENERGAEEEDFDYDQDGGEVLRAEDYRRDPLVLSDFLCIYNEIEVRTIHEQLRDDLMEHLWACHGVS
jgi:hypothetical protein